MSAEAAFDDADLHGLVDGRLEAARAAALIESLRSDPEARARLDAWRRQNDSLRTMFASVLAEPVPVRLLPAAGPRPRAARPDRPVAGAVATAVVGAALFGFALGALAGLGTDGFGLLPAAPPAAGRDLAARAAEAHRTFLADPARAAEVGAGDAARLARALRRRVGPGLRIPDLAGQGWAFLGGRIVPGRGGPAAFLSYGSGADRLGLLVSAGETGDGRAAAAPDAATLGVAAFGDGAFGYALTADRGREWLGRNLGPLRASIEGQARGGEAAPP